MGLDRLVTMPQPWKGNRNPCQWIAAAVCCMAGFPLAGCSRAPAAQGSQPVLASSPPSSAAAEPVAAQNRIVYLDVYPPSQAPRDGFMEFCGTRYRLKEERRVGGLVIYVLEKSGPLGSEHV